MLNFSLKELDRALHSTRSVNVRKLNPEAHLPVYSTTGSGAADLTASSKRLDEAGYVEYGTGLALAIPVGHVGLVYPRSSISKTEMRLCNSVGVIDSDYRGEIMVRFRWSGSSRLYEIGDRIAQIMVVPYPQIVYNEVDELDTTDRGSGGFGSTGV
jgi:dUTP pyrophosphatase